MFSADVGETTSFQELIIALADTESEQSYVEVTRAFEEAARQLCELEVGPRVAECHGDQHLGLEAARKAVWPTSRRCIDFAHLIGATKRRPVAGDGAEAKRANVWRAGIMSNLKKQTSAAEALEQVEKVVHLSRFLCQGAFATLWEAAMDALSLSGESALVATLRQQYLSEDADGRLDAHWRSGVDCAKPGFASGSQAQEAWHRWRLKACLPGLHREVGEAVECLKTFLGTRADYAIQTDQMYWDSPPGWQRDLRCGSWLKKVGRTTAEEFVKNEGIVTWGDDFGNTFYGMLRSHYVWNVRAEQ